jgi:hypothetical protein
VTIDRTIVVAATIGFLLAGCASTPPPTDSALTLADTKSAAQLLRNDAAQRLPSVMVKDVVDLFDTSVSCQTTAVDPDGTMRAWTSGATLMITNSQAARIDIVSERLIAAYTDAGWAATVLANHVTRLESPTRPTILVEPVEKSDGIAPMILIETTGPCVLTAGVDSDEVKQLEKAK